MREGPSDKAASITAVLSFNWCAHHPGQLIAVGCRQRRKRDQMVADRLRRRFRHIEASQIAHHRIADIKQLGVLFTQCTDETGNRTSLGSVSEITRQDRLHFSHPRCTDEIIDGGIEIGLRKSEPGRTAMTGMPGQNDRRQCPDLMAERLKREHGGTIADRTANDMAGDDDHRSCSTIIRHSNFKPRIRCAVDRPFAASLSTILHPCVEISAS